MPHVRIGHDDGQITVADLPDSESWTDDQRFLAIAHDDGSNEGIWVHHKTQSNSQFPAWISCSVDKELEAKLAHHFRCAAGEPDPAIESGVQ
jgi:hypothetical protein